MHSERLSDQRGAVDYTEVSWKNMQIFYNLGGTLLNKTIFSTTI